MTTTEPRQPLPGNLNVNQPLPGNLNVNWSPVSSGSVLVSVEYREDGALTAWAVGEKRPDDTYINPAREGGSPIIGDQEDRDKLMGMLRSFNYTGLADFIEREQT